MRVGVGAESQSTTSLPSADSKGFLRPQGREGLPASRDESGEGTFPQHRGPPLERNLVNFARVCQSQREHQAVVPAPPF